jgi:hypothetical protein
LADFADGGGGVDNIFRRASSNPSPLVVMGFAFTGKGLSRVATSGESIGRLAKRSRKAFDIQNPMNKIIPFCPKCQKPLTHVDKGYITVVESGGPSDDTGAVGFVCPSCRTLLGITPDLEPQIAAIDERVLDLPSRLDQ